MEGITSELIAGPLRDQPGERAVSVGGTFEAVASALADVASPGDLILTVGAGDVTDLAADVLHALGER